MNSYSGSGGSRRIEGWLIQLDLWDNLQTDIFSAFRNTFTELCPVPRNMDQEMDLLNLLSS